MERFGVLKMSEHCRWSRCCTNRKSFETTVVSTKVGNEFHQPLAMRRLSNTI